jgi:hypothetical protein
MEPIYICPKCGYNKYKIPSTTNVDAVKRLKQCSRCGFVGSKNKESEVDKEAQIE